MIPSLLETIPKFQILAFSITYAPFGLPKLVKLEKYYLVLKIINEFTKRGFTEVTFESVLDEVNKYPPARTDQAVKNVLASFANDLSQNPWRQSFYNKDLIAVRGLAPLVKRLKTGNYELLVKLKLNAAKSDSKKKSKGK